MFITDALSLSHVPRWAIVRTLRPQSVAEHSFNTAVIVQEILTRCPELLSRGVRPYNTIWRALIHDIDECVTGDIPGIAKRYIPILQPIVVDEPPVGFMLREIQIVKLADTIEAYTWITLNGTGPHAAGVADWLQGRLEDEILKCDKDDFIHDTGLIRGMVNDIINEKGRLFTENGREYK